jgi:predicted negative regulator of RcsB-dependent stress response
MSKATKQLVRIAKRLLEATGYLELGMIQHALDRLDSLGSRGCFEAEIKVLRGEALRQQNRYADAATALNLAARHTSSPYSKAAWLTLSLRGEPLGGGDRAARSLARGFGGSKSK